MSLRTEPAYMTRHGLSGSVPSAQGVLIHRLSTNVPGNGPHIPSRANWSIAPDSTATTPNIRSSLAELL